MLDSACRRRMGGSLILMTSVALVTGCAIDPAATERRRPAEAPPSSTVAGGDGESAGGGLIENLLGGVAKGMKEANDPVVVRGYIKVGTHAANFPLCLFNLRTNELQVSAVNGIEGVRKGGVPAFRATVITPYDCRKAERMGQLFVTNYTGMTPNSAAPTTTIGTAGPSLPLGNTDLMGLFSRHPYDGTPKTHFPKVAVTVLDWMEQNCWIAKATVWTSEKAAQQVGPFNVCWRPRMPELADIEQWGAVMSSVESQSSSSNSGVVRTNGPRAPMRALPERYPSSVRKDAYFAFLHALAQGSGWVPGAPTNLWIVAFGG